MARPYPTDTQLPKGQLLFKQIKASVFSASYIPPLEALPRSSADPKDYMRPIFEVSNIDRKITIYPYQVWGRQPMEGRYYTLGSIAVEFEQFTEPFNPEGGYIEEFLAEVLPTAFGKDYNYGLGFKKSYKPIISILEKLEIESLVIKIHGQSL